MRNLSSLRNIETRIKTLKELIDLSRTMNSDMANILHCQSRIITLDRAKIGLLADNVDILQQYKETSRIFDNFMVELDNTICRIFHLK